jgi:hypothetical protein
MALKPNKYTALNKKIVSSFGAFGRSKLDEYPEPLMKESIMKVTRLLIGIIAALGIGLSSCSKVSSVSRGGASGASSHEVEVSGTISDEEPVEFVQASEAVQIGGVNLTAAVSYDVTAYLLDAAGVKSLIFSGSFSEPRFTFRSIVPRRYIVLDIIRRPDGGKLGAVLPPPVGSINANVLVDGTTTIAAKMTEVIASKASSGDQEAVTALTSGSVSVADLLMVAQSVRTTIKEQKEQNRGSAIDISTLARNLVQKSNALMATLNAEGQTTVAVTKKLSEASYQSIFGADAGTASPGVLAYRTRPDLGASASSQANVAYEAIKASTSDSMKPVDEAFRAEATAYRTAASVAAAVASQTQVTNTFKTVFESCSETPSGCAVTTFSPPVVSPTSTSTSAATPAIPVITISSQPAPQTTTNGSASFSVTASVSAGASLTYQWQKKDSNGQSFINLSNQTSPTLSLTSLARSTDHGDMFRVIIRSSDGVSSMTSNSATLTVEEAPGAPTSVTGIGGDTKVDLTWSVPSSDGSSAITDYVIQYSSNSGGSWTTFDDGVSVSAAVSVTGIVNGTSYIFKVAAVNGTGTGTYSNNSPSVRPIPPACAGDCYLEGSEPNYAQGLALGAERQGPGGSIISLQDGAGGFKIWKEKDGTRILNATGFIANGWQKELSRNGMSFVTSDFTLSSIVAGRVCPPNVFIDYSNMTEAGRCLYYDAGNPIQQLTAAGGVVGEDQLVNWNESNSGRGSSPSYYEGNIKTCADKGMRLPAAYETTMNIPGNPPAGDNLDAPPSWAGGAHGVPKVGSHTWTASADGIARYGNSFFGFFIYQDSSSEYAMGGNSYAVRCVLPNDAAMIP